MSSSTKKQVGEVLNGIMVKANGRFLLEFVKNSDGVEIIVSDENGEIENIPFMEDCRMAFFDMIERLENFAYDLEG